MSKSKNYLNVPFAQKDAAKALGAKWDPSKKKWYAPSTLDITLFTKWSQEQLTSTDSKAKQSSSLKSNSATITYAKDKDFIAYNGSLPPWN